MGEKLIEAKEAAEAALKARGEFPIVAVSLETLDQAEIDKINANSALHPAS
jgi:hypothetical protein